MSVLDDLETPKASDRTITEDLMARLQRHYIKPSAPLPGGVFLPEVGWNGGVHPSRCDALFIGFTGSSGRMLVGHEVKASRSDWLNELSKPGKADAWADQCHEWWLVTAPGIVHPGELPAGWGHMVPGPSRTRMRVVTPARRRPDTHSPSWDATRSIIARLDTLQSQARAAIRDEERQRVADELAAAADAETKWMEASRAQTDSLRQRLKVVEDALGVQLVTHDEGSLHTAGPDRLTDLAALLAHHTELQGAVDALADRYGRTDLTNVRKALDDLEAGLRRARAGLPATAPDRRRW
ncbi:hypothetical protein [Cellulomonas rhizosphaerae]|uniref:MmcB family DNA repair protein n=1 Tax=Cellulomonas rhizosphaerae TaxID=2293719 RepID=A0A413RJH5_9CELL|nr:hypothetical protein [Cellulomonas rhizosphaerae]RHA38702.1 hypothetical protein D1825_13285 [Cellulomonas rhizosphaerae]